MRIRSVLSPAIVGLSLAALPALGAGWNILREPYLEPNLLDGFAFEWQYFMVHDARQQFTGSIGYVLADPRGHLGEVSPLSLVDAFTRKLLPLSVMPSGANIALAGQWGDGSQFANYERFDRDYEASLSDKSFNAESARTGSRVQLLEQATGADPIGSFRLKGETRDAAWDLVVTPDALFGDAAGEFSRMSGTDVGYLPGEQWNVHMEWPRTRVVGTMTNRATNQTYPIDGHGYRENSWGRWNFAFDGWTFSVVSDRSNRVEWAWQTYHKSKSMDWLDVRFEDGGATVSRRFFAHTGQLRWNLNDWFFHSEAHQCVPNAVEVVGEDVDYRIRASYDLTDRQLPMLSTATPLTSIYVIMIHMPYIKGVIENVRTGAVVARFEGQGGGEFSTTRSLWSTLSARQCAAWGQRFNQEYALSIAPR
jgi:hypothetical protein